MKRRFSVEEAMNMVMQPGPSSELQDLSSETETCSEEESEFVVESDSSASSPDPSPDTGEDTEDPAHPSREFLSKNGQMWSQSNSETTHYVPASRGVVPGATRYAISHIDNLESSFDLFLTAEIINIIIDMTNLHGRRSVANWTDVDEVDVRAYVGLLILAGVYKSKGESSLSLWDPQSGRAIFPATMSHKKFKAINSTLRFDDKLTRPSRRREDKLAPIRKVWEMWTHRLPMLFNPGKNVCIDEQLVPFKGRCSFRQYMPSKPAKYGLKVWITADVSTSYAWKCQVYTGKAAGDAAEKGQGKRVVLEMTEELKGVTVTCDNFFTSYSLVEELLKRKMALVGTIRKNKPELPPKLLEMKGRPVYSSVFAFTETTTAVSYIPRRGKNVILLSSKHREAAVNEDAKRKPIIITDYNRCKGGVDNLDKVVATYSCRRKTRRWPQVLFYNIIDVSAFNSFVLFTAVDPSWNQRKSYRRRLFLEALGKSLVSPQIKRRQRIPRAPAAAALVLDAQGSTATLEDASDTSTPASSSIQKRGLCWICTGKKRKATKCCIRCCKFTCTEHQIVCCRFCWKD